MGEMERPLTTRLKDHRAPVCLGNDKSALTPHCLCSGHSNIDWDHVDVMDIEPRRDHRKVIEAMHIRLREAKMN